MQVIHNSENYLKIQGLYSVLRYNESNLLAMKVQQKFIQFLQIRCNLEVVIITYHHLSTTNNVVNHFKRELMALGWEIMQQQLTTAQFSDSIATYVTAMYGVHSRNTPMNHILSHIYTPLPLPNHVEQHRITH